MEFTPAPETFATPAGSETITFYTLSGDDVPDSMKFTPEGRPKLYLASDVADILANQQSDLQRALVAARLASLKQSGMTVYSTTFRSTVTAGDNLAALTWQWSLALANGKTIAYPERSLPQTDGSQIASYAVVNGQVQMTTTAPKWQKWGGIAPGGSWSEQFDIMLCTPTSATASIIVTGGTAGSVTRTVDSNHPRFVDPKLNPPADMR